MYSERRERELQGRRMKDEGGRTSELRNADFGLRNVIVPASTQTVGVIPLDTTRVGSKPSGLARLFVARRSSAGWKITPQVT
jgi:hypothetical protein